MKIKLTIAAVSIVLGVLIYLFGGKTLDNEYILSHGWKGGGCGLPDVLDFRGDELKLQDDDIYMGNDLRGRIVERKYRFYADSYIEILTEAGERCPYWDKWSN